MKTKTQHVKVQLKYYFFVRAFQELPPFLLAHVSLCCLYLYLVVQMTVMECIAIYIIFIYMSVYPTR